MVLSLAFDRAGGLPVLLPHTTARASARLDAIGGLIVTGGYFDIDPALFGAGERHDTVKLKALQTDFELAMTRGALERDMPVLDICGGPRRDADPAHPRRGSGRPGPRMAQSTDRQVPSVPGR